MFVHGERPMKLTTPLGEDKLLLISLTGHEGISELFHYQLDLVSEENTVDFDKLLGQKVSIEWRIDEGESRYFCGIVSRFSQAERSFTLTRYSMEVVPQFWLLTRHVQSRIFQQKTIPEILKEVLTGMDVTYETVGTFEQRDYCTQYRESDFHFASRLMEEEGIYYYFKHDSSGHKMVIGNTPQSHPDLPGGDVPYEEATGGVRDEARVWHWEKIQDLRSGKYTLWDHCFELPGKHLEAGRAVQESVTLGRATHKLQVGGNTGFEVYDYPGEYAQRFDGIDKSGGERASDVQKIFQDNARTVGIRMEAETANALLIRGGGNCGQFTPGYKFGLARHFSDGGKFVLVSVDHVARQPLATDRGHGDPFEYDNRFTAIPFAIPYRPARVTTIPTVRGSQTATVVGPSGEEIFTDKYGRIKVQFHWDRQGQLDAGSSCWVRVATPWAGKQWGMIHIPRIGQEVVVDFLEGHPDQPIVVGSVYNADQMPPYKLPDRKTKSGVRSRSSKAGVKANANEIRFEDLKGSEQVFMNAEKNMDVNVENDCMEHVGHDRHIIVDNDKLQWIKKNTSLKIGEQYVEQIGGAVHVHRKDKCYEKVDADVHVGRAGKYFEMVDGDVHIQHLGEERLVVQHDRHIHSKLNHQEKVDMNLHLDVGSNHEEKVGMKYAVDAGQEVHIKAGMTLILEAGLQISLKVGSNFIDIGPAGVAISGMPMVMINSGGSAGSGTGASPNAPMDPESPTAPADPKDPTLADDGTQNVD